MIIKQIEIKDFGSVAKYNTTFNDDFVFITDENADDIFCAIAGVLSYPDYGPVKYYEREGENFFITYKIKEFPDINKLNTDNINRVSKGYMDCSIFSPYTADTFKNKLSDYIKALDYSDESFSKIVNAYGGKESFMEQLMQYITEYIPQSVFNNKDTAVFLTADGIFETRNLKTHETVPLTEHETLIFNLFCFSQLNKFWTFLSRPKKEKPNMPIMIRSLLGKIPATDFQAIAKGMFRENAQIIVA